MRRWIGKLTVITNRPEAPIAVVVNAAEPTSAAGRAMRVGVAKWKRTNNSKRVVEYHLVLRPGEKIPVGADIEDQLDALKTMTLKTMQTAAVAAGIRR